MINGLIAWLAKSPAEKQVSDASLALEMLHELDTEAKFPHLFIGGPKHGQTADYRRSQERVTCHETNTTYLKHWLGFDEKEFVLVFVHEAMHLSEALDLAVTAIAEKQA